MSIQRKEKFTKVTRIEKCERKTEIKRRTEKESLEGKKI